MAPPTSCRVLTNVAAGGDVAGDDGVDHGQLRDRLPRELSSDPNRGVSMLIEFRHPNGKGGAGDGGGTDLISVPEAAPDRPPRRHALSPLPNGPVQPRHPDRLAMAGVGPEARALSPRERRPRLTHRKTGTAPPKTEEATFASPPGRFSGAGSWPAPAPAPGLRRPPGRAPAAHGRTGRASWWPGGGRGDRPPS